MPTNSEGRPANGTATGGNGKAKDAPPSLLGGIQQRVTSRVDEQKNRAADGLGGIASVFQQASHELRDENEALASYVDMAGDQMRRLAEHIRQRGVADMLDDVSEFARRRPAVFIGGAFLVGLSIARFMKSSSDRASEAASSSGFSSVDPMTSQAPSYGTGGYGDAGY